MGCPGTFVGLGTPSTDGLRGESVVLKHLFERTRGSHAAPRRAGASKRAPKVIFFGFRTATHCYSSALLLGRSLLLGCQALTALIITYPATFASWFSYDVIHWTCQNNPGELFDPVRSHSLTHPTK